MATEQFAAFVGSKDPTKGDFILLSDEDTTGDFMTHYFISRAVKAGHRVCLVSLLHEFVHYNAISAKLGTNLQRALDSSQIIFVDCLSDNCRDSESLSPSHTNGTYNVSLQSAESLKVLHQIVTEAINSLSHQRDSPVCVVLDDVNVLLSLGQSLQETVSLVSDVYRHLLSDDQASIGYLVVMSHDMAVEDNDDHLLYLHLLHKSHLHLKMTGLKTGYSKDVHGELNKQVRDPFGTTPQSHRTQTHSNQYKILDKGIRVFARGTTEAVL